MALIMKNQGKKILQGESAMNFLEERIVKDGIVKEINAEEIGKLACYLGAGRVNKEDKIEPDVGIVLNKKIGDEVITNDFLTYVCGNDENKVHEAEKKILEIYKIS